LREVDALSAIGDALKRRSTSWNSRKQHGFTGVDLIAPPAETTAETGFVSIAI